MSLVIHTVINVVLIPGGIVAFAYLISVRPWRRATVAAEDLPHSSAIAAAGIGCACAYVASHFAIVEDWRMPSFPPGDKGEWLLGIALIAALYSVGEAILSRKLETAARFNLTLFFLRAIIICLALWLVFSDIIGRTYPQPESAGGKPWGWQAYVWFAGLCVAGLLQWELNAALARRLSGAAMAGLLLPVCAATGISIFLDGDAKHGLLAASIASSAGAIMLASWISRSAPLARGLVAVATPLLYSLVLCGRFFAETPLSMCALLVAAPLAGWVAELPPIKRLRPWQAELIRLAAVCLVAGAALAVAYANKPNDLFDE